MRFPLLRTIKASAPVIPSAYPTLGRLKIGGKATSPKSGKEYPVSYDHFVADGDYKHVFDSYYGEQPTALTVTFPTADPRLACHHTVEARNPANGRLIARQTAENVVKIYDEAADLWSDFVFDPENAEDVERLEKFDFRDVLVMHLCLPHLRGVPGGVWRFETHAAASAIPIITQTFDEVASLFEEMPDGMLFMPFLLTVEKVSSHAGAKPRTFPVIRLYPKIAPQELRRAIHLIHDGSIKIEQLFAENFLAKADEVRGLPAAEQPALPPATEQSADIVAIYAANAAAGLYGEDSPAVAKICGLIADLSVRNANELKLAFAGLKSPDEAVVGDLRKIAAERIKSRGYFYDKTADLFLVKD